MEFKSQIDGPIKNTPDANDDDDDDNCTEHPRRMEIGIEEKFSAKDTINNEIFTPANFVVKEFSVCLGPPINLKNLSTYRKKDLSAENDYVELKIPKQMRNKTSDNDVILSTSSYTKLSCITTPSQFIGPFDHEFLVKTNKNEKVEKKSKTRLFLPAENDYVELESPKRMRNKTSDNDVILSTSSYTTLSCMTTPNQFIGPFDHEFLARTNKNEKVEKKSKTRLVYNKYSAKQKKMTFNRFFYYSNKLVSKSQRKLLYKSIDLNFSPDWEQSSKLQYSSQNVSIALIRKIKMLKKIYERTKFKKLFGGMKMSLKKLLTNDHSMFVNYSKKLHLVRCYQKLSKYYLKIMKLCYNTFKSKSSLLEYDCQKKSKNNVTGKYRKQYLNNMKKKNKRKKKTINYFINNIILPVFVASTYYYDINYSHNFKIKSKQTWKRPVTLSTDLSTMKLLTDIEFVTNVIPTNINDNVVKKIKTNGKITYDDVTASLHTYEKKLKIVFTNQQMTRMADNFYGFYNYNKHLGNNTVIGNDINEDSDADDNDPLDYFELVDSDVDMSEDFFDLPLTSANQTITATYVDFIGLNSTRSSVIRRKNDEENKLINENKTKLVEKCYDYFFNVNFLKMISRPKEKFICADNVFEMVYNGRDLNNAQNVSGKIETITKSLSSFSPIIRFNKINDMKNTVGSDNSINNFDMNYYYLCQRNILDKINLTNTSIINDNTVIKGTDFKKKYAGKMKKKSADIDYIIHDLKTSTFMETTNLIHVEDSNSSSSLNSTYSKSENDNSMLKPCNITLIDMYFYFNKKKNEIVTDEVHNKLSDEVNDTPLNDNTTLVENDLQENSSDRMVENKDTFDDIIDNKNPITSTEPIKLINVKNINFAALINSTISSELEQETIVFERNEVSVIDNNNFTSEITNDVVMDEVHNNLSDEVNDTPLNNNTTLVENDLQENSSNRMVENKDTFDDIIDNKNPITYTEPIKLINVENMNFAVSINSTISSELDQEAIVFERGEVSVIENNNFISEITNEVIMDEVHNKLFGEVNDTPLNDNTTLVENGFQENNLDIMFKNIDTFDNIINQVSISTLTDIIKFIDIENIISKEKHVENIEEKETDLNKSIYEVINDIIMYDKVNDITEVEYLENNKLEMEMDKSFPPKSCSVERCDGKIIDSSNYISDVINEVTVVTNEDVNNSMVNDYFDSKNLEIEVDTLPGGSYDTLLNNEIVLENEFIENTSGKVDDKAANFEDNMNPENISISMEQMGIVDIQNFNCANSINSIIPDVSTYSTNFNVLSTPFMQSKLDKNIIALDICEDVIISNKKESENINIGDIEMVSKTCLDKVISNVVTTDQCFDGDEQLEIEIHEALPSKSNTFADVGGLSVLNDENIVVCGLNDIGSDFDTSISDISSNVDGSFSEDCIGVNVESEEEEEVITMNLYDINRSSPVNSLHDYMETIDLTNDDDDKTDLHYLHNTSKEDIYKVVLSQVQKNDTYEQFVSMYKNDINKLAYKLRQAGIGIPIAKEDIVASRMTVTFIRTYKKWFEDEHQDADVVRDKLAMNVLKDIVNCMKKKDRRIIGHVDECKMTIAINVTFKVLNVDQCFTEKCTNPIHSSSFFFSDVLHNDMSVNSGLEVASQNEMVNLLNGEEFDVTFMDVNGGGSPSTNVCTIMINKILNMNFENKIQIQIKTGDETRDEMTCKYLVSYTTDEANDKLSITDNQFIVNELSITDDQFIVNELSTNDDVDANCFNDFPTSFDDFPMGFDNAGSLLFL